MDTKINVIDTTLDNIKEIMFNDIFNLDDIQQLQDLFSDANEVASIIKHPDGTFITTPSNYNQLYNDIVCNSKNGHENCLRNNTHFINYNLEEPFNLQCKNCGLLEAGAKVIVGGHHIANWFIGQVKDEEFNEQQIEHYANKMGVDKDLLTKALKEIPIIPAKKFEKISRTLSAFVKVLSDKAYNNLQLKIQIAEREKVTKLLVDSETRFQLLFNKAPLGYQSLDCNAFIIEINQQWLDMLGYTHEEVIGKHISQFISPEFGALAVERFGILKEKGKIHNEFALLKKDGTYLYAVIDGRISYDENGEFKQTHCLVQDITEKRKASTELYESRERYKELIELAVDGILVGSKDGDIIDANTCLCNMLGKNREDLIGNNIRNSIFTKESIEQTPLQFEKLDLGEVVINERKILRPDGTEIIVEMRSKKMPDNTYQSILRDITERKTTEARLMESEARFRNILQSVKSVSVQGYGPDGTTTYWNKASELIYGYTAEEAIGKNLVDLIIPPEMRDYVRGAIIEMAETGIAIPASELLLMRKDGSRVSVYSSHTIIKLQGRQQELFCIDINLEEQKQTEVKLIESEARYKTLFKTSPAGIMVIDENGVILEANEIISEMTQFSIDELIGSNIMILTSPENRHHVKENIKQILSGKNMEQELVNIRKDGTSFTILLKETAITLPNGQRGILSVSDDITERKKAELVLKESEENYRDLFEANSDGITIFLVNNKEFPPIKIIDMNENAAKMLGYTKEEMLRKSPFELERGVTKEVQDQRMMDLLTKGSSSFETNIYHKEGYEINVEIKVLMVKYNNQPALMNIVRDITERKKTEKELILAKEKAEESDRLKSAFLANMSHEIRTPMNGILGFAELLKEPMLSGEELKQYISIIEKSGLRMLNIINDIISISKIESGLMEVLNSEVNINEQIDYIYTFFKPEVEKKNLQLTYKNNLSDNYATINTDREKIDSVIINLVKNAIKYTHKGTIEFGYNLEKDQLVFFVKDTGIGIPKERQEAIFERFIQADIDDRRAYQGAGLGLSISKAYIEMLGGKLWVESEEGKGSEFYFTLPYNHKIEEEYKIDENEKNIVEPNISKNLKILIAEDDLTSEVFLKIAIKKYAREIIKVKTGIEAIDICKKHPDLDLILMDIRMPEMNGYEATKQIRQINKEVIIIAQTAFALSGDGDKAIEAGCNDYISKPILKDELLLLIEKYFNK